MYGIFRNRTSRRGELVHVMLERTLLTSGTLLITVVILLLLFLGVYFRLA